VIAAVLLVACGGGSSDDALDDPELQLGRDIYEQRCASCHGNDGGGGMGPALGDGAVVERLPDVADHRAVVVDGRGGLMPAWGDVLDDDEIDAVVRYEREALGR
jgi:mono/diheme cytochrome c family protein